MDKNLAQNNLISVIIATKNGGRFLARSIDSIEKQSEKNFEVIIISDGSTDDTVSIAKKLAETRSFIKIVDLEKNIGPGLARNLAVKEAHGQYIVLLDDDDEWLDKNKIEIQKKFLIENPDYVLVGADLTEFVSEDGKPLSVFKPKKDDGSIRSRILIYNQFITSSVMFRKNAFEKVGGFADMRLAEDYDLWLRLAQQGKVANLSGCKTRYYKRLSGAALTNRKKLNKIVLELVKKYGQNFPHSYIAKLVAYLRIAKS